MVSALAIELFVLFLCSAKETSIRLSGVHHTHISAARRLKVAYEDQSLPILPHSDHFVRALSTGSLQRSSVLAESSRWIFNDTYTCPSRAILQKHHQRPSASIYPIRVSIVARNNFCCAYKGSLVVRTWRIIDEFRRDVRPFSVTM